MKAAIGVAWWDTRRVEQMVWSMVDGKDVLMVSWWDVSMAESTALMKDDKRVEKMVVMMVVLTAERLVA